MGKKKKFKKLAESNIQMLKSGKLKITKGEKIDISSFISKSVENTIISRLDAIISKEEVVIDTKDLHPNNQAMLINPIFAAEAFTQGSPEVPTIIIPINKKNAIDIFDYLSLDTIGIILRSSTLASCYKKVKSQWVELNDKDGSAFTNVLFIPEVMVFLDFKTGKIRKEPFKINVLMVAHPSVSKMKDNSIEKIPYTEAASRIIADMVDSAIKCGCKNIILDPYSNKTLNKERDESGKLWNQISTSEKFIENFKSVTFAMEDEEAFVTFNAQKRSITE